MSDSSTAVVVVPVAALTLTEEPRYLQLRQTVPEQFGRSAEAVEAAYRDYRELALSRQGLQRIYIVTLTLALSMALLVAIALAVLLANRLSQPLVRGIETHRHGAKIVGQMHHFIRRVLGQVFVLLRLTCADKVPSHLDKLFDRFRDVARYQPGEQHRKAGGNKHPDGGDGIEPLVVFVNIDERLLNKDLPALLRRLRASSKPSARRKANGARSTATNAPAVAPSNGRARSCGHAAMPTRPSDAGIAGRWRSLAA